MKKTENLEDVLKAIRAHCLDCCCGAKSLVENCSSTDCHLYPYRTVGSAKKVVEPEVIEGQITMFDMGGSDGEGLSKNTQNG